MKLSGLVGFVSLSFCLGSSIHAQSNESRPVSRLNTFGIYVEYSNDSSHMVMGRAENRKLVALGGSYALRLWRSHVGDLRYIVEARPVLMESDPVLRDARTDTWVPGPTYTTVSKTEPATACHPGIFHQVLQFPGQTVDITDTDTCERRWVFAQGFSPVGLQYGFRPGHRLQPLLTSTAGYMFLRLRFLSQTRALSTLHLIWERDWSGFGRETSRSNLNTAITIFRITLRRMRIPGSTMVSSS